VASPYPFPYPYARSLVDKAKPAFHAWTADRIHHHKHSASQAHKRTSTAHVEVVSMAYEVQGEGRDTYGIEVGNCIPLPLADNAVELKEFGCRARMTGLKERLIRIRLIVFPILPRRLSRQQPYIELATFPSSVVCYQLCIPS
jgi:hypothetical protein